MLTRIAIIDQLGTDHFSLLYEYADGTQSDPEGSYFSFQEAYNAAADTIIGGEHAGSW